jgi:signal transduction histidine kinase
MTGLRSQLDRWSLQYRITAGVGVGLALILALFGYVALWSVGQATDQALRERQGLTALLAHQVERALVGVAEGDSGAAAVAVRPLLDLPEVVNGGHLRAELIDNQGAVLAATEPPSGGLALPVGGGSGGGHGALLADLIAARRPGVRTHRPPNGPAHIVAYQPLSLSDGRSGWGVTVEQNEDTLLELPRRMRLRMLLIGAAALAASSALAWLDARRVVRPLRRVTAAAQRIADGDLTVPLADGASRRRDEVGQLTVALDTMRQRLVRSLAAISDWNQELEERVGQRTREIAALGEQRRQLLRKVIWAQEEERKRLARELHDDTVQTLSGLAMTLQAVEDVLPARFTRQRERLAWAREQAVHAAREIRQLILGLRPSALDDLGLIPAVRWYASAHLEPLGLQVEFDAPQEQPLLPPLIQTAAFRVLQEASANVAKHAHAHHVIIRVRVTDGELQAAVEDDGQGFDPEALLAEVGGGAAVAAAEETGRGLGVLGMHERVALLGGVLTLRSEPGKGTVVAFSIPLAERLVEPFAEEQRSSIAPARVEVAA